MQASASHSGYRRAMLLILTLLWGCAPDCEDGYGFADGECVPIDTEASSRAVNWGGGSSAALFYERLITRYCQELRRCGATGYQTVAYCSEFEVPGYSYDYDYGSELAGCTSDSHQANLCISGEWACQDFGEGYLSVQLPEACYAALDADCSYDYYEPYYYGYYDYSTDY